MSVRSNQSRPPLHLRSRRGSALLSVLIFSFVIAFVLASQLSLSRGATRLSNRGFYTNAALGLAETGLEQAMWSLTAALNGDAGAWSGWTTSGDDASRKFSDFDFGKGATGEVNVSVSGYAGTEPVVLAKARITLGDGTGTVEKWLKLSVASSGSPTAPPDRSRSLFAYGLLARESIYANGGAWLDSWQSDPDNNPATPSVPWSAGVARDNARVAVQSTANGALWIDGADVYGAAAVGGANSSGLKMKDWDGWIGPRSGAAASQKYRVVPGSLSFDFAASYQTVNDPTGTTVQAPYVLPRNVSGPPYYISSESIGTTGQTTVLQMNKLTVEGAATLTIKGDVTIFLPPSGAETIKVGGSGKILLENGATLSIYTPGNITVSGAGIANSGPPSSVQIWSTRNGGGSQSISLQGSGALNAVIYAPDADLTLPGHTDFSGAAVVRTARLTGSGAFHYDESLEYFTGGSSQPEAASGGGGVAGTLSITAFEELDTPAERSPYLAMLAF